MKKLIEVSLKSIIFFIGWTICASVIPIPDIDNAALWRFFAELIPFLAIVVMSVIFWLVDRKKTKLHKKSQTDKHEVVLKCSFYDDSLFSLSPIKGAFHFLYILQNTFLLSLFIG